MVDSDGIMNRDCLQMQQTNKVDWIFLLNWLRAILARAYFCHLLRPSAKSRQHIFFHYFVSRIETFKNIGILYTVKPRFWNTSWSAANVFQNRGLFQYRGPHFGRNLWKMSWVTILYCFYAIIFLDFQIFKRILTKN